MLEQHPRTGNHSGSNRFSGTASAALEELVEEQAASVPSPHGSFSPHFPKEKLVSPGEYHGFSAEEIASLFGLPEPASVKRKIYALKSNGTATIRHYDGGIVRYDLRGHSHHFLGRHGINSSYSRSEALTMLEHALGLEGVNSQNRTSDAEGI